MEEVTGMAKDEVLATADYRIHGEGWNGPIDMTVHAELLKSGAFDYGNGTCTVLEYSNGQIESFDTRYENVNPKNFSEFAFKVLRANTMDRIAVECL